MIARRGDAWIVNLDPVQGHEQAGQRPALVLSVDELNASKALLVTVLPITSRARSLRTRVTIHPPEAGLSVPSYVICEQVRTVSTERLRRRLGSVSEKTLARVVDIVRMLLGL